MNAYLSPSFATSRFFSRFGHPLPNQISLKGLFARVVSLLVLLVLALPVASQDAATLFPRLRRLTLEEVRVLARSRSANIALSDARLAQASASRRDIERRIRLDTTGGLDPFSRQVRFYISLDLERLLGLNRQERERARQVEAEGRIGQTTAQADALRRVTTAWYATLQAQNGVVSATRVRQTTAALFLAADARFKSGQGELGVVLGALRAREEGEDAYERARQGVALACLDLAQACGYASAEEMEAAL